MSNLKKCVKSVCPKIVYRLRILLIQPEEETENF